ncbi:SGNH hydrolase [Basidiobolus meristosporus CBS 931.73]|uniref:SGNH hydrolase n=1 Tax=Basidiobolus meristosporus CBS 931.73 TaxID=1314790 RepID=A0A1Y1Y4X6_9FUNG|nr:SGNH hydrolase [Basidiobolus meristosporus CBS 931.73]|eukprot:ORX93082.1 SGNH hydrolase [Basidiobolus meristosporus CBS 931.73]
MRFFTLLLPLFFATLCYGSLFGSIRSGLSRLNPFSSRRDSASEVIVSNGYRAPVMNKGYIRPPPPRPRPVISNVVVFGDSHSDTGNTRAISKNRSPPPHYFQGRYSNGPNWVDYVGKNLGIAIKNFAYGGGTVDSSLNQGIAGYGSKVKVPGIAQQVDLFLNTTYGNIQNTLFLLCGGSNDYFMNATVEANDIQNAMRDSAEALLKKGATSIALCTLPPLTATPMIKSTWIKRLIFRFAEPVYNYRVRQLVSELQIRHPDRYFITWDLGPILSNIIQNAKENGFTNTYQACVDEKNNSPPCKNPDEYVYWDSINPTTRTHKLIAESFQALLKNNFVYRPYYNQQYNGNNQRPGPPMEQQYGGPRFNGKMPPNRPPYVQYA